MLNALLSILNTVAQVGKLVLWGAVEAVNMVLAGVAAAFAAAAAVLPSFPDPPSPPSMIAAINWFFPVGSVLSVLTSMMAAYVTFLGVRWLFKKVGTL